MRFYFYEEKKAHLKLISIQNLGLCRENLMCLFKMLMHGALQVLPSSFNDLVSFSVYIVSFIQLELIEKIKLEQPNI